MQNEERLVERAKNKDQQAFSELYEAYFDKIYRYIVLKTGDREEAEDMTQQVFLKALRSISSFKWKGAPFSAWLYRIAHNQIVDHLRKRDRHPSTLLNEDAPPASTSRESNPQKMTEHALDMEQVLSATQNLTDSQREVISLRFTSDLPTDQVAKIMGKNLGAIKALQHSAILALRKTLTVETNGY